MNVMLLIRIALAFTAVTMYVVPASAGFQEGYEAFSRGDYQTAIKEYRPLAEQGNRNAQYNMGLLYDFGNGVPQDHKEAHRWYEMAASQGHAEAQANLGVIYHKGEGVTQDFKQARKWFELAVANGDRLAMLKLGLMYERGEGVLQDYLHAHKWYNLAAADGIPNAAPLRDAVAKMMTPAQIAEAQRLAREWKLGAQ